MESLRGQVSTVGLLVRRLLGRVERVVVLGPLVKVFSPFPDGVLVAQLH